MPGTDLRLKNRLGRGPGFHLDLAEMWKT